VTKPPFHELVEQPTVSSTTTGGLVVFVTDGLGLDDDFEGFGDDELFDGLAEADGEAEPGSGADGDTGVAAVAGTTVDSTALRSADGCTRTTSSAADAVPPARTAMKTTRPTRIAAARAKTPRARKNWRSLCLDWEDNGRSPRGRRVTPSGVINKSGGAEYPVSPCLWHGGPWPD
jgi:hypothetical protein